MFEYFTCYVTLFDHIRMFEDNFIRTAQVNYKNVTIHNVDNSCG